MARRTSRHRSAVLAGAGAAIAATAIAAAVPMTAQAAVACTEPALVQAITAINAAGGGNVVLTAGCTYNLTTSHGVGLNGPDGLPIITTVVTLTGNANVITRSSAALFRLIEVSRTGNLTLKSVTLSNGRSATSGGGILNFGAVTLTASALTNNSALLGTGGGLSNADTLAPAKASAATITNSTVTANTASGFGGGVYNGLRGTLTATSSVIRTNASLLSTGGGIGAINSTATTVTSTPVNTNKARGAGGIFRTGGVMTINTSPITANTPNNCVGSVPTVPGCIS
jgi:hypothetical protein